MQTSAAEILARPLQPYVFVRESQFYVIELHGDEDARNNALCNPGTVRVEDMLGNVVWSAPAASADQSSK